MELFFWKIVKIEFKNESYRLFLKKMVWLLEKTRFSITFSSLVQLEPIEYFKVDKSIFYEKEIFKIFISSFWDLFVLPTKFQSKIRMA